MREGIEGTGIRKSSETVNRIQKSAQISIRSDIKTAVNGVSSGKKGKRESNKTRKQESKKARKRSEMYTVI